MVLNRDAVRRAMTGTNLSRTKMDNGCYPEVTGTAKGETGKRVGRSGRFFSADYSSLRVTFSRTDAKMD